jgi:hypothetical protein
VRAGRGFVVDTDLAETDPAGEALEEAIAFGKLAQRRRGARRQQAEVAGIFGRRNDSLSRWALAV